MCENNETSRVNNNTVDIYVELIEESDRTSTPGDIVDTSIFVVRTKTAYRRVPEYCAVLPLMSHLPEFVQQGQDRHGVRPVCMEKTIPDHLVVFLQGLLERLVRLELLLGKLQHLHLPSTHDVSTQRRSSTSAVRVTTVMLSGALHIRSGWPQQHRSLQAYMVVTSTRQTPIVMQLTELHHCTPNTIALIV